jgi:hypothetical protein
VQALGGSTGCLGRAAARSDERRGRRRVGSSRGGSLVVLQMATAGVHLAAALPCMRSMLSRLQLFISPTTKCTPRASGRSSFHSFALQPACSPAPTPTPLACLRSPRAATRYVSSALSPPAHERHLRASALTYKPPVDREDARRTQRTRNSQMSVVPQKRALLTLSLVTVGGKNPRMTATFTSLSTTNWRTSRARSQTRNFSTA